ncbi:hypothetical protein I317_06444 [Kwoniella heveanensis CBS 569]|nr:hypothetical protein I317_06444 [Kwoniella heveanensis CBS 569]
MGRHRLEDVSCAICMDPLFTKRDDLDDLVPIATCDCGHVLHEPCLLEWFRTQSDQYLAQAREHGIEGRHGSPTLSDAPAECPTCRAECYADPETGQPSIHRLYIDWGGVLDNVPSQSQVRSSPVRSMHAGAGSGSMRTSVKDKEILGLARRAKGVAEEAKNLGAESNDEEMQGMLKRAGDLEKDCVSVKALEAVKSYVGGLATALDKLDRTLRSHPLIPGLKARHDALEQQLKDLNRETRMTISREIKKARDEERSRSERKIHEAEKERNLMQKEMLMERTGRKRAMEAYEAKEKDLNVKLEQARDEARKERESREAVQSTLSERMRALKVLQSKADSRKDLKRQIEQLQAENDRLKDEITASFHSSYSQAGPSRSGERPSIRQQLQLDDEEEEESESLFDRSQSPVDGSLPTTSHQYPPSSADDSLQVDMPSFLDDSSRSIPKFLPTVTTSKDLKHYGTRTSPTKRSMGKHKIHPTARTIVFDQDEDERRKEESRKRRKTQSKYFEQNDQYDPVQGDRALKEIQDNRSPSMTPCLVYDEPFQSVSNTPHRAGRSNQDDDAYEIIPDSEPAQDPEAEAETRHEPQSKRSKTNPFASTRQASERRKQLPSEPSARLEDRQPDYRTNEVYDADKWKGEVIDLAFSSSPPSSPGFKSKASGSVPKLQEPTSAQPRAQTSAAADGSKGSRSRGAIGVNGTSGEVRTGRHDSVIDFLGLRDANGRPKKGVISGHQKIRRRF